MPLSTFRSHPHFPRGGSDVPMLFNVVEDVGCEEDLAGAHPEIVARLLEVAEKARADLGDAGKPGPGIRPLGYSPNPVPGALLPEAQ